MLSVGVPLLVIGSRGTWTLGHTLGLLVLDWAGATWLWAPDLPDVPNALWGWELLAGAVWLGSMLPSVRLVWLGAGLGIAVNGGLALWQALGWSPVFQVNVPAGLFVNRILLGETAALVLVALVVEWGEVAVHRGWASVIVRASGLGGSALALALAHSRGALAGAGVALGVALWGRSRCAALGVTLACALALGLAYQATPLDPHVPQGTLGLRLGIFSDVWPTITPWGQGIGTFYTLFPLASHTTDILALGTRPIHAHNEPLEFAFEIGWIGLALACVWWVWCLAGADRPARGVLLATSVIALVSFPLHNPTTLLLVGIAAGRLCRVRGAVRLGVCSGRMVPTAWPWSGRRGTRATGARSG